MTTGRCASRTAHSRAENTVGDQPQDSRLLGAAHMFAHGPSDCVVIATHPPRLLRWVTQLMAYRTVAVSASALSWAIALTDRGTRPESWDWDTIPTHAL